LQIKGKKQSPKLTLVNIYQRMNFQNVHLPDFLVADLFKDNLVVLDNEMQQSNVGKKQPKPVEAEQSIPPLPTIQKKIPATDKPLSYLGKNNKHISIVVYDENAIHLQDDLLEMLSAILNACKLNLADVSIINTHTQLVNDELLRKELSPAVVLLFGIPTAQINLPFSIPDYKAQAFNNCTYLQAASLQQMNGKSEAARLEKSKLWVCLKNIFGV